MASTKTWGLGVASPTATIDCSSPQYSMGTSFLEGAGVGTRTQTPINTYQRSKRQRKRALSTEAHARRSSGKTPQKQTVWHAL